MLRSLISVAVIFYFQSWIGASPSWANGNGGGSCSLPGQEMQSLLNKLSGESHATAPTTAMSGPKTPTIEESRKRFSLFSSNTSIQTDLQNASFLEVRASRIKTPEDIAMARVVAQDITERMEKELVRIKGLPEGQMTGEDKWNLTNLPKTMQSLLEFRYLNKTATPPHDFTTEGLSIEELNRGIEELSASIKKLGGSSYYTPPEFKPIGALLDKLKAELKKRPQPTVAQGQVPGQSQAAAAPPRSKTIEEVAAEYKAEQARKAYEARANHPDPLAHPLTDVKKQEIATAIEILKKPPSAISPEEAKKLVELQQDLYKRYHWRGDGKISGMYDKDLTEYGNLRDAWNAAANRFKNMGGSSTMNIAQSQGRYIRPPTTQVNRTDSWGTMSRPSVVNTHAARIASSDAQIVMDDLRRVHPPSERLRDYVQFRPVISSSADLDNLARQLQPYGITPEMLRSANITSTLDLWSLSTFQSEFNQTQTLVRIAQSTRLPQLEGTARTLFDRLMESARNQVNNHVPHYLNQFDAY
jgi:hypothetical protein